MFLGAYRIAVLELVFFFGGGGGVLQGVADKARPEIERTPPIRRHRLANLQT